VLAGDRDAYRVLVERESRALVRICYRVLGDPHEAEDAAQEAFVTAFRALATWRSDGPFGAWIARIGLRIALRSAARRRPVAWLDPASHETPAGGGSSTETRQSRSAAATLAAASIAAAPAQDPAHLTLRAERASAVRSAVAALDEPYREVVALRFFADLTLAEIAAATGRPLGTVKTHLHRGLLRVRRSLEGEGPAS
jgi:RNA polymerase sigma-70 factor (ECF subfamily)